jgi:hypothetical protein
VVLVCSTPFFGQDASTSSRARTCLRLRVQVVTK